MNIGTVYINLIEECASKLFEEQDKQTSLEDIKELVNDKCALLDARTAIKLNQDYISNELSAKYYCVILDLNQTIVELNK